MKINIAVVGLSFGSDFVPIYKMHPDVESVFICDASTSILNRVGDYFNIRHRYSSLDEVLKNHSIDAVHLATPIPLHEEQSINVLEAGKHCACTVPMATSLEGIRQIIWAARTHSRNYMMMETAAYTRQMFYVSDLYKRQEFGKIQFMRGGYYQDMAFWPNYWHGLPPMWYVTHVLAPLLALTDARAIKVHCFGSGTMREELTRMYHNPYPVETAVFKLDNGLAAEVTRTMFETARAYTESFTIYGSKKTFEWQQLEHEDPVLFEMENTVNDGFARGRKVTTTRVNPPDRKELLPPSIQKFTEKGIFVDNLDPNISFEAGGGHDGSHPHLAHEFVRSIVEQRHPQIDEIKAAEWTAPGICAHLSAMRDGAEIVIPDFRLDIE